MINTKMFDDLNFSHDKNDFYITILILVIKNIKLVLFLYCNCYTKLSENLWKISLYTTRGIAMQIICSRLFAVNDFYNFFSIALFP